LVNKNVRTLSVIFYDILFATLRIKINQLAKKPEKEVRYNSFLGAVVSLLLDGAKSSGKLP